MWYVVCGPVLASFSTKSSLSWLRAFVQLPSIPASVSVRVCPSSGVEKGSHLTSLKELTCSEVNILA